MCGTKVVVTCHLAICFTRNMASAITDSAGRSDSNAADVVRCLNALTSLDIRNIASDDVLTSLVTDYFVTRQVATSMMAVNLIRVIIIMLTIDPPPLVDTVADEVNSE